MNIPIFGLSLLISIGIILVHGILKVFKLLKIKEIAYISAFRKRPLVVMGESILTLAIICTLCFGLYFYIIHLAISDDRNNLAIAEFYLDECTPVVEAVKSDRMVILRLDDVQAYGWTEISIQMMNDAQDRKMKVVAGVIPSQLDKDFRVRSYLKKNLCNIEIAMHGYTHNMHDDSAPTVGEFGAVSADVAREKIRLATKELNTVTHDPIYTFIPPQNDMSAEAESVLSEFGIRYLSSEGKGIYDYDASTWKGNTGAQALAQCEKTFESGDKLCVIMLHPQDFSNDDHQLDPVKYQEYVTLLNGIEGIGATVVGFEDITLDILGPSPEIMTTLPTA